MAEFTPKLVAFCCQHYGQAGLKQAAQEELLEVQSLKIIEVPCSGKVDVLYILKAFEEGADGVYVAGCLEGDCYFRRGNIRAKKRVQYLKGILEQAGIGGERLAMFNLSGKPGESLAQATRQLSDKIKELGPNPGRSAQQKRAENS